MSSDRETALEQAAVALLSEAKERGVDLTELAHDAATGVMENKPYTWVGADDKVEVVDAIDFLLAQAK